MMWPTQTAALGTGYEPTSLPGTTTSDRCACLEVFPVLAFDYHVLLTHWLHVAHTLWPEPGVRWKYMLQTELPYLSSGLSL